VKPRDPTPERWRKIDEVFHAAVERPVEQRDAFLDLACAGDDALRAEVEELLGSDGAAEAFLESAVLGEARWWVAEPAAPISRRLGPYRIVGELGHGGMGAVYLAVRDDDEYRKEVAIKLLPRGLETGEAVARFRDERQILAALEHPGIVRLLDGGSTEDGLPFLVMERVEGATITEYCDGRALPVRERLLLFRQVCAAAQYAHQRLVVHRDIKPSNILVGADGTPKLLDFGIARLLGTEDAGRQPQTRTGMHRFTPEYGSPEQARGEPVTTATDVYSLGAVLYELLTGARPHRLEGDGVVQMLRAICDVDPLRPSAVAPPARRRALRGDLDNIVLKALNKAPGGRYASVEQLSEDLRRHLEGQPVAARAGTWAYRAGKFVRRERRLVAAAAVVLVTLSAATVVSLQQARRAERRFADVRRLASSLVFEVDEGIKGLEGSTAARELIVSRALEYLDTLSREAGDDVALSRELAAAYVKIGEIQGSPRGPNLGRPRDGIESHLKARHILDRLAASGREDASIRWSLARTLYGLADVYRADGRLEPARESLLEATRLVESIPKDADFDHEAMVRGYLALFQLEDVMGDPAAMAELAQSCLETATEMAALRRSPEARYWMGIAHEMAGHAQARSADPEAAVREFERATAVFEELMALHPENASYRRELSMAYGRLAGHLSGTGEASVWEPSLRDPRRAEEMFRKAIRLREWQLERDPEDQRGALETANRIAQLAVTIAAGDPQESSRLFQRAAEIHRGLPVHYRRSGYSRQLEWFTHCSMAEPLARLGRRAEAAAAFREGLAIAEHLAREAGFENRLAPLVCRYQAARSQFALGEEGVAERLEEVAAGLRQLIAAHPSNVIPYIGLVETLQLQAEVRPRSRCDFLQQAEAAWLSWPGASTSLVRLRRAEIQAALAGCSGP
jgi:tetratricopeptide (TPR) repeat protein